LLLCGRSTWFIGQHSFSAALLPSMHELYFHTY
jgi:hypothetical protein